jgi:hypothetical protein
MRIRRAGLALAISPSCIRPRAHPLTLPIQKPGAHGIAVAGGCSSGGLTMLSDELHAHLKDD